MSKVYYLINEKKEIIQDGFVKFNENCLEIEQKDYFIKNGYNGKLFFADYMQTDEYKEKARIWEEEYKIQKFRAERETECFPIINRGNLWYDRLTIDQKTELEQWYQNWLDITKTQKIPEKPTWLK